MTKQLSNCCKAGIVLTGADRPNAFACEKCGRIIGTPEGKNIIDGEECCYRCGMSRADVKRTQHGCNSWGKTYPHHMWTYKEKDV